MIHTTEIKHRATADLDKNLIQRQIDKLVYDLYDLTEDEIKIVEGKGK